MFIYFTDSTGALTFIGLTRHNGVGRLRTTVQIPITAPTGKGNIRAVPFTILGGACRVNPFLIGPSTLFRVTETSFTLSPA